MVCSTTWISAAIGLEVRVIGREAAEDIWLLISRRTAEGAAYGLGEGSRTI